MTYHPDETVCWATPAGLRFASFVGAAGQLAVVRLFNPGRPVVTKPLAVLEPGDAMPAAW